MGATLKNPLEQVEVGEPVVPVNGEQEIGSSFVWVSQLHAGVIKGGRSCIFVTSSSGG